MSTQKVACSRCVHRRLCVVAVMKTAVTRICDVLSTREAVLGVALGVGLVRNPYVKG